MPSTATIPVNAPGARGPAEALVAHWPEYLMEAAELGLLMLCACAYAVLLGYPASAVHQAIDNPVIRRALMGLAMGATVVAIIHSP